MDGSGWLTLFFRWCSALVRRTDGNSCNTFQMLLLCLSYNKWVSFMMYASVFPLLVSSSLLALSSIGSHTWAWSRSGFLPGPAQGFFLLDQSFSLQRLLVCEGGAGGCQALHFCKASKDTDCNRHCVNKVELNRWWDKTGSLVMWQKLR